MYVYLLSPKKIQSNSPKRQTHFFLNTEKDNPPVQHGSKWYFKLAQAMDEIESETYRVRNYRGRVSNFDQSEARKQCFLASDWLNFDRPFPENTVLHRALTTNVLTKLVILNSDHEFNFFVSSFMSFQLAGSTCTC